VRLGGNKITHLPESFGNLKSLKYANFKENKLTKLPESFGELKSLEKCWLSDNQIPTGEIEKLKKKLPNCAVSN